MTQHQALVIVDVQNDFCEGGSLPVPDGSHIVDKINQIKQKFQNVFLTVDWHPANHVSFYTNHANKEPFSTIQIQGQPQILWPPHCIQNSKGAEFHPDLQVKATDIVIRKAYETDIDSYSGFGTQGHETLLNEKLQNLNVSEVFIVGIAYDFCVLQTAISALKLGYKTYIVEDCTKAIDLSKVKGKIDVELSSLPTELKDNLKIIQLEDIQRMIFN